jgi:stage II sporulation protein D
LESEGGKLYIRNGKGWRRLGPSSLHIRGCGQHTLALTVPPLGQRRYHGDCFIKASRDCALTIVNDVSLNDYIKDVVASELPAGTPGEALKAQAVLAQTLLLNRRSQKELGDSTEQQSYLGAAAERPEVNSAVRSVWGKHLYYKGLPVVVYYHSTCAGGTSQAAEFFGLESGSLPYLKHVPCTECRSSPFWRPTKNEIPLAVFAPVFGNGIPTILKRDEAGRPLLVKLADGKILSGYDFWMRLGQSLGWDKAPGTRYQLASGGEGAVKIESTGAGHGVGLCQWGASGMAREGKDFREILNYYFPDCEVR